MGSTVVNIFIILIVVASVSASQGRTVKKRQIFREEVLPHAGGKIPDTAFQTDRLFLNRLQKEGIAVPDGIILEQRNPQVYPYFNKQMRNVFKVALSADGRYTPSEGRYHYDSNPSVETTYLVPQVHNHPERTPSNTPAYPVYRQLQIQNPLLNQPKFQPKKKSYFYLSPYSKSSKSGVDKIKIINPQSKTINFLNDPLSTLSGNQFEQNYDSTHLFNEFDQLFNSFDFDDSNGSYKSKSDKKSAMKNGSLN